MSAPRCSRARGSTLLEVALAIAVMAVCVLGQMSTQLALARNAQAAAMRERAAFAADAIAQAASVSDAAVEAWKARAQSIVPDGQALVTNEGDASLVTVTWTSTRYTGNGAGAAIAQSTCGGTPVPDGRDCLALAFTR